MDYCGETRTVDMHIRTLRQKLGPYGRRIETVRNVGYRMEGNDMTKKIFQSILLVAGCVLLASLLIIMGCLYDYFGGVEENQLRDELSLAAAAVEDGGTDYLSQLTADRCRLTWIAADGSGACTIPGPTPRALRTMPSRAEVKSGAGDTAIGESTRYSSTLHGKDHVLRPASGRTARVLRISISRATVGMIAVGMIQPHADRAHRGAHSLRLAGQTAVAAHRRSAQQPRSRAPAR